ncbi:MAG: P-loop NTPase [Actinomycetia bacterium]|nr:P-loop NTPase [Actinomycetes bacterium]
MRELSADARRPFTIAVASGKGGTGKTLVATNLAVAQSRSGVNVVLVDCDVEAPNDHLFLKRVHEAVEPVNVLVAEVDAARCTGCGQCRDSCAYGAVRLLGGPAIVFEELCHGCGSCLDVCAAGAMAEVPRCVGEVLSGPVEDSGVLTLVTGRLDVGQVKSPAVIRQARAAARLVPSDLVVLDAPPGVACAAVAAVRGADALLLVTEPTPFGLHDLQLSMRLGQDLDLPMGVVVNRDDGDAESVSQVCSAFGVPILARIPFDRRVAEVYARGGLAGDELPEFGELMVRLGSSIRGLVAPEVLHR